MVKIFSVQWFSLFTFLVLLIELVTKTKSEYLQSTDALYVSTTSLELYSIIIPQMALGRLVYYMHAHIR